jgi:DNA-binding response OmpR family regulator
MNLRTADLHTATPSTRRVSSVAGGPRRHQPGRSGPGDRDGTNAEGARPTRHILLLDDEEGILLPTGAYFRNLGFEVDMARESEEAEALVHHRRYDLAVLDLRVTRFGGTEGLEVLREIRRRDHTTKVIILSAYISAEAEAEAWALGADSVLRKPQPLPHLAHLAFALMGTAQ